ncbi:MAG: ATP-binding protein [Thermodesulfobacteriota bacterium]
MGQCNLPEPDWIEVAAEHEGLALVQQFVLDKARSIGVLPEVTLKIELVLEEVILNIMSYAYGAGQAGTIKVGCALVAPGRFQVRIVDQGPAFDPLAQPDPDTALSLDDRNVGGLGIHLVQQMADQVEYQRQNGQNILDIMFRW